MVDLDPQALFARGISPADVSAAINAQNLILPAGELKIGDRAYPVVLNSSPSAVAALNEFPIKQQGGATVLIRDVAHVRDGAAVQSNVVRQDGTRGAMVSVLRSGGASTLDIVNRVKARLPKILATLPPELNVRLLLDQSVFVRATIQSLLWEALLAAFLVGGMILLFLGSWRSTLVVWVSIPLSILVSMVVLYLLGQTINLMTLGGLSLAVGILVDDATVEVENIHRNLAQGKTLLRGILDGAQQIAVPAFVSTLAICIVFVPVVFLGGAAKYLFQPLAMAVVFAMLASYLLSRTLVPTMVRYLLERGSAGATRAKATSPGFLAGLHRAFDRRFGRARDAYGVLLAQALRHRRLVGGLFAVFWLASALLATQLGQDFFPQVDAGQLRLHVRAPAGTRLESTEAVFDLVEQRIREVIPPNELDTLLDNIGLPAQPVNFAYSDAATLGSADGEILLSLKANHRRGATWDYARRLREELPCVFPGVQFFFQSADMVNQIVNFGILAPIDIQVTGRNLQANYVVARDIERRVAAIPGAVDVHVHQVADAPTLRVNVDRVKASQFGLTQRDIANTVLASAGSTAQVSPNFWVDPASGVSYLVAVQTPQYRVDSLGALARTPLAPPGGRAPQLLANLAHIERQTTSLVASHYNIQPVVDVLASVQDRDLGAVAADLGRVIAEVSKTLPRGTTIQLRGQVETMRLSFMGLAGGLVLAIVLVYLLMVVNYQTWLDPFVILLALPGAFSGIVWALFVTHTTLSVPSLMGAIMSIGVATANSILVVTFANGEQVQGADGVRAALAAGVTRFRPVVMTALAMMLGMLPMAMGLGQGGEQNAPLARAVIGGLLLATVTTLVFVPVAYSVMKRQPAIPPTDEEMELLS